MKYDLVIVGGGLAGSLLLAGIRHHHPRIKILLLEKSQTLGGNHTWCFHQHDLPEKSKIWLLPLVSKVWDSYEVRFPTYSRVLNSKYFCIKSEDLHEKISKVYEKSIRFNCEVISWQRTHSLEKGTVLQLSDGSTLNAGTVIDARGWVHTFAASSVGWQKFVGLEVKLKAPHGLQRVLLKDVTITQIDGYRFFYLLPFSETELLVEDTYYSNHAILKDERIEQEIKKYIEEKGWEIETIKRKEIGCLPLTMYPVTASRSESSIGAASLIFNPVTGYTLPMTLQLIDQILESSSLTENGIAAQAKKIRQQFSSNEKYYRLLNRMMFLAAEPTRRYLMLERFYRLNEDLIQRFYSGQLGPWDRFRILFGKPPVPIFKALRVLREA
jgi:lycopene beta-cyclase